MLKTYSISKNTVFYYDLEEKCIARFPSKSNLLAVSSDNSLYFGMCDNETVESVFCKLFNSKEITNINGMTFKMKCLDEIVDVIININSDGQVQIKMMNSGSMFRLANNYSMHKMKEYDFTKMLIVMDFKNNEIRFKDPEDFKL